MNISEETKRAIQLYADGAVERYARGSMSHDDWENARSYAVEAINGVLKDNPGIFDYVARIDAEREKKNNHVRA